MTNLSLEFAKNADGKTFLENQYASIRFIFAELSILKMIRLEWPTFIFSLLQAVYMKTKT